MKKRVLFIALALVIIVALIGVYFIIDKSKASPKLPKVTSVANASQEQIDKWRKETDKRIEEIRNSPNMEIPKGATVYYVSSLNGDDSNDGLSPETPFESLGVINSKPIAEGSYVCFERGSLWRGHLAAKNGVTYTAYGKGEKPKIYRSPIDGAEPSYWKKTDAANVWAIQLNNNDVGTLVFNGGDSCAIKCIIRTEEDGSTYNNTTGKPFKTYKDLCDDLHFYHDYKESGILYLYSEQNPGERFVSIEFNSKGNVVSFGGSDVTIDNLCIKYGGSHGVGGGNATNLTVTNCELGWIGGSIQAENIFGRNYATRFGNAIEVYGGCDGFKATNNYIYQVYDAGITQQVGLGETAETVRNQKNINYSRNVIEYCNYSIEYFLSSCPPENPSRIENFLIEDNYMWYAGTGFCEQRPDPNNGSHINSWSGANRNRAVNYTIKNNYMLYSREILVQIYSDLKNPDGTNSMPTLENNHFLAVKDSIFGIISDTNTERQKYNEDIIEYLGDKSKVDTLWMTDKNSTGVAPKAELKQENGVWYYYENGKKTNKGGLVEYCDKKILLQNGVWKNEFTGLTEYNGKQYYIENGKWKRATHTVIEMDKTWVFIKKSKADELVNISGEWYYILDGIWDKTTETLYEKGDKTFAVKNGKWHKEKAIIDFEDQKYYVDGGFTKPDFNGKVTIDGKEYIIEYGRIF